MKVEIKELDRLVRELSVQIPAATVQEKMDAMFAEVRRSAAIRGFRKGKAPMNMIRSAFGSQVKADVADELIKSSYPQAVKEKTLDVASFPTVTAIDYNEDGSLTYKAKVEVMPVIDTVNLDNLEIFTIPIEVKDEEVDKEVDALLNAYADFRTVDRPAADGDAVMVDLKKLEDPAGAVEFSEFPDSRVDLGSAATIKEFRDGIPGMKAGDEKEIEVAYAEDYSDKAFAGARIKYLCRVKEVREKLLPAFDDAFAKRTQQAETALELRLLIRESLKSERERILKRAQRSQLVGQVVEHNNVPLPHAAVQDYLDALIEDRKKHDPDMDEKEARESGREVAERTVRWNILYHRIAQTERIEVSEAETDMVIKRLAAEYKVTPERARRDLDESGKLETLRDTVLENKVIDFLMSKAKVRSMDDIEPTQGETEDDKN